MPSARRYAPVLGHIKSYLLLRYSSDRQFSATGVRVAVLPRPANNKS